MKYIGKSSYAKRDSDKYLGSGFLLMRAVKKYGKHNFSKKIIDNACSQDELNSKEVFWIDFYDACNSKEFYNIASGGTGGHTTLGYSSEQNDLMRQKRSAAAKGKINLGAKNHCAKSVICLNTMEIFESGSSGARKYGILKECVYDNCNGKTKTAGIDPSTGARLQWKWYIIGETYILNDIRYNESISIKVKCITTGEIFDSIEKARKAYKVSFKAISDCCAGVRKSSGKSKMFNQYLVWEYA